MRVLTTLFLCIVIAGCANTSRRAERSEISVGDIALFNKTFVGILVDITTDEYTTTVPQPWYSFASDKVTGTYLRFKVRNAAGKTRVFFDYSEDAKRVRELQNYYRDLAKGASIVVDLGPRDENGAEERFDSISIQSM